LKQSHSTFGDIVGGQFVSRFDMRMRGGIEWATRTDDPVNGRGLFANVENPPKISSLAFVQNFRKVFLFVFRPFLSFQTKFFPNSFASFL
jgi:hypothetical protein